MAGINTSDYSTMSVTNAAAKVLATACSPVMPSNARGAFITCEDAQARWRPDGTAPTTTEGHVLDVGDSLNFSNWSVPSQNWRQVLEAIQFIATTATTSKLKITWFR